MRVEEGRVSRVLAGTKIHRVELNLPTPLLTMDENGHRQGVSMIITGSAQNLYGAKELCAERDSFSETGIRYTLPR